MKEVLVQWVYLIAALDTKHSVMETLITPAVSCEEKFRLCQKRTHEEDLGPVFEGTVANTTIESNIAICDIKADQ